MTREEYTRFAAGLKNATRGLIELSPDDKLDWRPDDSFMKLGAVIRHLADGFGDSLARMLDNDWPEGSSELPTADAFPTVGSTKEGLELLDVDWKRFEDRLGALSDDEFNNMMVQPPWMPAPISLRDYMLMTAEHQANHKMQLFTYLRLLGEKIHTGHLYGMMGPES
jgi:uncharacterized damage-inducible protein DinB